MPRRGGNAGGAQHIQYDLHGKIAGGKAGQLQVFCGVDEHLVDGVDVDVLRLDVLEVDLIDARAVLHVVGHARRRDDIFQRQRGVLRELRGAVGRTGKRPPRRGAQALGVDGAHALDDLEQPRPSGYAHGLQRGRDGQADRLLRAPLIRDDQMGIHGIQSALNALDRSIEGFQVDGDIGPLFHASTPPYPYTALLYTKIIVLESGRMAEILQ